MRSYSKIAALALLLPLTVACSLVPDAQRPSVPSTAAFSSQGLPGAIPADQIAADWWKSFGSAELDSLIARALAENTELRASVARIEQARAQLKIAGADLAPSAAASAGISRTRENPASGSNRNDTELSAGLTVAYEVDLFGRNRAAVAGARSGLRASELDREALNLLVMGDVARTYFMLVNGYERLKIADDTLRNVRRLLDIVNQRLEAGAASRLEVAQQKSALGTTEAQRATIVRGIATAENALAVLVGAQAQSVKVQGRSLSAMKIPAVSPGQPSRLLERRPDIRRAEEQLYAANADIAIARAAFFPTLTLGLDAGLLRAGLGDPTGSILSLAAGLAAPIFQGGRLQGGVAQATARQTELAENYRKTVLLSFQEVEDALASTIAAQAREKALTSAAREAASAYGISRELYDAGATDFQTLLDVQRDELAAKDAAAQAQSERLTAAVDLYLALGGGWSERPAK